MNCDQEKLENETDFRTMEEHIFHVFPPDSDPTVSTSGCPDLPKTSKPNPGHRQYLLQQCCFSKSTTPVSTLPSPKSASPSLTSLIQLHQMSEREHYHVATYG